MRLIRSGVVPGRTSLTFVPLRHGPACVIDRGMTTDTTNRRSIALIVAGFTLLLVAGAGWIHTSPRAPLGIPVHWDLTGTGGMNSDFGQHHAFEPTQAESMTTLEVHVEIRSLSLCASSVLMRIRLAHCRESAITTTRAAGSRSL